MCRERRQSRQGSHYPPFISAPSSFLLAFYLRVSCFWFPPIIIPPFTRVVYGRVKNVNGQKWDQRSDDNSGREERETQSPELSIT